ncbi:AmmeMemoRadiSam system protein A [bacterium]|nr:AmmeMemoRadiSam system protein A [bacterium]
MSPLMEMDQPSVGFDSDVPLTETQQVFLLQLAWQAVQAATRWDDRPEVPSNLEPRLRQKQGAFVTLHGREQKLRGCIGYMESHLPLAETVTMAAHAAASRDPRFQPVRSEELDELEIEISVLSTLREVASSDELVIGRDGLVVSDGRQRGLLLPQVAVKQGWSIEQFLGETCRKAGLPFDCWKESRVLVQRFSAEIFSAPAPETH